MKRCVICNSTHETGKKLSTHLRRDHGLTSEEYTVTHLCGGSRPTCEECGQPTRFVSFGFKKFCSEHARLAMKKAGATGGKAQAWNKGKTKETDARVSDQAKRRTGKGNPFFGRKHTAESLDRIRASKRLSSDDFNTRTLARELEFEVLTGYDEYVSRQAQYLDFRCITCSTVQPKTLQAFERGSRCYVCHPFNKSNWELDVLAFVRQHCPDAVSGDRTVIGPKEIDVYVPSRALGIECHGLYWHSELSPDGVEPGTRKETVEKIAAARDNGVQLIQFFDDEWRDHRRVCESLILHRLGISPTRIWARKCSVVDLDTAGQRTFFDESHLAGYTPASRAWGLQYDDRIVAALSVRKPRNSGTYPNMLEVARFATTPGAAVVGGLARLLKQVSGSIMTYVDRRIGTGAGYEACGFVKTGQTGLDYWYTDGTLRYDRFKYRASNGTPEREIARVAGVGRIWGCGSYVMVRDT